jgi:FkbM family methyltransferase
MSRSSAESTEGLALPILGGPLRGLWWLPRSGGKVARLLLGTYESRLARVFAERVKPRDEVLDLGAAAGFYTLLAARRAGPSGRVFACEPDPVNLRFLRAHVARNGFDQVRILPIAVGAQDGHARFAAARGSGRGRLSADGALTVEVRTLDSLASELSLAPAHVKLDVEGAELAVLSGAEALIRAHRPTLYLSTHDRQNPGVEAACRALLESWSYSLQPIETGELLCTP